MEAPTLDVIARPPAKEMTEEEKRALAVYVTRFKNAFNNGLKDQLPKVLTNFDDLVQKTENGIHAQWRQDLALDPNAHVDKDLSKPLDKRHRKTTDKEWVSKAKLTGNPLYIYDEGRGGDCVDIAGTDKNTDLPLDKRLENHKGAVAVIKLLRPKDDQNKDNPLYLALQNLDINDDTAVTNLLNMFGDKIHDDWMLRNERGDWNADQFVDYSELKPIDQFKDFSHLIIASEALTSFDN